MKSKIIIIIKSALFALSIINTMVLIQCVPINMGIQ